MKAGTFWVKPLIVLPITIIILILGFSAPPAVVADSEVPPKWTVDLPSKSCPDGSNNCHVSSPVLADLTNDGFPEIIVATNNGHVVAINRSGAILWARDVAAYFGMAPGAQEIFSSPAVGDIDQNGWLDIVIGAGSIYPGVCTQGGVIALDHQGNVKEGWPRRSLDNTGNGCRETVYGTPALGDLTGDGYLEVIAGSFDKRIYAWRYNGALLPGFPVTSKHHERFPHWGFEGTLGDTIWSSPSLADLTGDGYPEIIIGSDEGNYDDRWGGDSGGWSCPYALPPGWASGYCGGSLYVVNRFGEILPGFPKYILEIIQSTPAVADVTGDGWPDIFVGTGTFYHDNSPDRPTTGFRVYGWDRHGNPLPGWSGGRPVSGPVSASPTLGDITGDGNMEIVIGTRDHKLYAWRYTGELLPGFPMTPRDRFGNGFPYAQTFILADYTGDGKMEIIFNQASMVTIINGQGQQLTQSSQQMSLPAFRTWGANRNSPAVGDLDGNGRLDLIAHNSKLYVWDLSQSGDVTDWPMFKSNAQRTSRAPRAPQLSVSPGQGLLLLHPIEQSGPAQTTIWLRNLGDGGFEWSVSAPSGVTVSPAAGVANGGQPVNVTVSVDTPAEEGTYQLGALSVTAVQDGNPVLGSPASIPITLYVGQVHTAYLPAIQK